jgi:3-oxoacyl-[acyl-carrier-protein] synthase II
MTKRVVVTGMSAITALGHDWPTFSTRMRDNPSGIRRMDEWDCYAELNTRLGGAIPDFETPAHYNRKKTRSMGRVSLMATRATEVALAEAGLLDDPILGSGKVGIAYGSSSGTPSALKDFGNMLVSQTMAGITATTYIRMMSHTTNVNIGVFFGIKGRIYTTSTACTSGSMGIGSAYEAIKFGKQTIMIAGGGEELCATQAAVFDTLYATSTRNDQPHTTPAPFDANRDGLVIGEGAGTLILEDYDHAVARGANILAEIVGYATNSDGGHVTQPDSANMEVAMRLALEDAGFSTQDIAYINAHGTATDRGDVAESQATARLFGNKTPISTLKGNLGHTLGACGAIEAWATLQMMRDKQFAPTHNLKNIDPNCGELDYIMGGFRNIDAEHAMSNNFAFGGINTSLIFKRV